MLNENTVRTVSLQREGRTYSATYFIENGILQAIVEGQKQTMLCSMQGQDQDQVRALLEARILEISAKTAEANG
jgi:hypothetical protein